MSEHVDLAYELREHRKRMARKRAAEVASEPRPRRRLSMHDIAIGRNARAARRSWKDDEYVPPEDLLRRRYR